LYFKKIRENTIFLAQGALSLYCTYDRQEITGWFARGAVARVSVNFRKFSPCIARTRRARVGLTFTLPLGRWNF
jgi:hypothetical protein